MFRRAHSDPLRPRAPLGGQRGRAIGALGLAALLWAETHGLAYVRELNAPAERGGVPLTWRRGCIFIELSPTGPDGLPIDTVLAAIEQSGRNWTDPASSQCGTYLRFVFTRSEEPLVARRDLRNVVVFYQDVTQSVALRQNLDAPAITTLTSIRVGNEPTAQIIDADTEINDDSPVFRWGVLDPNNPDPDAYDIENTLTHEFGHTLGLGHSCWDGREDSNPRDHNNALIPSCPTTGPALEATMYYSELSGEISKRNPMADELQGICDIYPPMNPAPACLPLLENSTLLSGCTAQPGGPAHPVDPLSVVDEAETARGAKRWRGLTTLLVAMAAGFGAHRLCRKRKLKYAD